jgi:hypothetical protein
MKVKHLIKALQQLEADEFFVLVAQDPEGNLYRDIEEVVFENSEVVIYPNDECYQMQEDGKFINLMRV